MAATVAEVWRHPVKSMRGERVEMAKLLPIGLEGDRRLGVMAAESGQVLAAKRVGSLLEAEAFTTGAGVRLRLPDSTELAADDPAANGLLSAWLGRQVRLEAAGDDGSRQVEMYELAHDDASPVVEFTTPAGVLFDVAPVHLLTTASVREMQRRRPDSTWDVRRFRPTMVLEADGEGFVEDDWVGATLRVGGSTLKVVAATGRCTMVTRAQPGLPRDVDVARSIKDEHDYNLGVYAEVVEPGVVRTGDEVTLLA